VLWPDGNFPGAVIEMGPWFDGRIFDFDELSARLEAQTHRRYIKTHTPADGIPIFDTASYIVVARDGRDAFVSFVNHLQHMRDDLIERLNAEAKTQGIDPVMKFRDDIHGFSLTAGSPTLLHCATLPAGGTCAANRTSYSSTTTTSNATSMAFLNSDIPAVRWPGVVERCTFERMRADADKVGDFQRVFEGGAESFFFKGTNGRWREVLTEGELRRYRDRVEELLAPEAAHWLEHGSLLTSSRP
jgi:aryl sulfotransferase